MYHRLPIAHGKGMHLADRQIIHVLLAGHDLEGSDRGGAAVQALDLFAHMQITGFDPAVVGGEPGVLLGGVDRFVRAGRGMAAMTGDLGVLLFALRGGSFRFSGWGGR